MLPETAQVRPFPWTSLEVFTRAQATAWNDLLRWVEARAHLRDLERVFVSLLGTRCEIIARSVRVGNLGDASGTGLGVLLEAAESDDRRASVLLDVEPALAAHVVAHATKRDSGAVIARSQPSARVAGAFGAVLATGLRRLHTWTFLRVAGAGASADLAATLESGEADFAVARVTVVLGDAAYDARIMAPASILARAPDPPWSRERLARLGPLPLSVPLVAWSGVWPAAQVAEIRPDDAVVLPDWTLRRIAGHWVGGPVWLATPFAELGARARFDDTGALVLGREMDSLDEANAPMSAEGSDAVLTTIGDALLSLRVEIATAVLPAREWAALGPGAIVMLGHRVGEPVVLRVGGVPVARGDLVEVDGQVGVRIIERVSDADCP